MDDTALLQLPQVVNSSDKFAVFTQVARLLAAEDIIVRWNVRGLGCPASMNYASRVLSVAPVKVEHEDMIPGLILHEVGHFIFSKKATRNADGTTITNVEELEQFREKIKNHHIWNIIEDGYIERRLVAKWPGALKHLRVLYDYSRKPLEIAKQLGLVPVGGSLTTQIIDTLHLNVMGAKWDDRYPYPAATPRELLTLLEQARCTMTDEEGRAELSSQIVDELVKLESPYLAAVKKFLPAPVEMIDPQPEEGDAVPVEAPAQEKSPEEAARTAAVLETLIEAAERQAQEQREVDIALDAFPKKREPQEPADGAAAQDAVPPTSPSSSPTKKDEEQTEDAEPAPEEAAGEEAVFEEVDPGLDFEQFISDQKAKIIGSNLSNLARIEDVMLEQEEESKPLTLHVSSPAQVMELSDIRDIIHPKFHGKLRSVPFYKFISTLLRQESKPTLKAASTFNSKTMKAKAIAQQMFQRFATKANAQNVALTKRRQTGRLDPTRAALFKIYDDVFERRQVAPNQVNHSYVVMVDWSGSMSESVIELFHRVAELTYFAQLAGVELDIWLYTTGGSFSRESVIVEETKTGQEGLLTTASVFVNVLNTKKHAEDELSYRLFALFLNACAKKSRKHYATTFINGSPALFDGEWLSDHCMHDMHGTNIFEALSFASELTKQSTAQRKSILLVTDGDDCAFGYVLLTKQQKEEKKNIFPVMDANQACPATTKVMYGTINIYELGQAIQAASNGERNVRTYTPLSNIKTLATALLNENLRSAGVAVTAVTWGNHISPELLAWTREKVIRVEVPTKDLKSSNISRYTPVNNQFITLITEALLANIGASSDAMLSGR